MKALSLKASEVWTPTTSSIHFLTKLLAAALPTRGLGHTHATLGKPSATLGRSGRAKLNWVASYLMNDLLLRAFQIPGLMRQSYDRSLQSGGLSETGNWVVLDGKFNAQLAPGRWYLGVTATGSDCRYRLKLSTGNVNPLALSGGDSGSQSVVGADWRYLSVVVPENAPPSWHLEFTRTLGNARLYLRDTVPPGDTTVSNDSRYRVDWATDGKNTAPHPFGFEPGSYDFTNHEFRPGHTYYLGVTSTDDATFRLTSSTVGAPVTVPALVWSEGQYITTLPGAAEVFVKAAAPPDAHFLRYTSTHTDSVLVTIEEGLLPFNGHYQSDGPDSTAFFLFGEDVWPWQAARTYYFRLRNLGTTPQNVTLSLRNVDDDLDDDGFADDWERTFFGSAANPDADPLADPDGDNIPNILEYALGTSPVSAGPRPDLVTTDAQGHLVLSLAKPQGYSLLHVEFIVEAGDDLSEWSTEGLQTLTDTSTQLTVKDTSPPGNHDSRYIHLRVVLNP